MINKTGSIRSKPVTMVVLAPHPPTLLAPTLLQKLLLFRLVRVMSNHQQISLHLRAFMAGKVGSFACGDGSASVG